MTHSVTGLLSCNGFASGTHDLLPCPVLHCSLEDSCSRVPPPKRLACGPKCLACGHQVPRMRPPSTLHAAPKCLACGPQMPCEKMRTLCLQCMQRSKLFSSSLKLAPRFQLLPLLLLHSLPEDDSQSIYICCLVRLLAMEDLWGDVQGSACREQHTSRERTSLLGEQGWPGVYVRTVIDPRGMCRICC